jgi:hypothetical protein
MLPVPGLDYGLLDGLLGYALRRAQNALYLDFYRATAAWDVSPQRFAALVLIARNPGLRQGLLGQAPDDARAWGLHLTPTGKRLLAKLEAAVAEHDRVLTDALGDQGPALKAGLERLARAAAAWTD